LNKAETCKKCPQASQRACHIKAHFQSGIELHHWSESLGSARSASPNVVFWYLDVSSCSTSLPLLYPKNESMIITSSTI
jgi:hypothetical protein